MKNILQKSLFILLLCTFFQSAKAYVHNTTQADALVHWTSGVTLIDIFVNPSNSQGFPSGNFHTIAADSIAQWDGKSRLSLRKNTTAGMDQSNLNEVFFSSDPAIFNGTGVVGLTQVYFKNNTGEIIEADILLNDTYSFSTDINDVSYLGNVLTHELGHFLGLGHSQVASSSMFYALTRGQNQLSDDDKAGVYSIYPNGDTSKGIISGAIVGGKSLTSVFGAHVQAISLKTGRTAGATISDTSGRFTIDGLDRNEDYFIYTSPTVQVGLPNRYSNARYDFCDSSTHYRGSFFQSCGLSSEGFPQAIKLNSAQVDVGNITIRCGLDVPVEYMDQKGLGITNFELQKYTTSGVGNAFTGFFTADDVKFSYIDYFNLDYSNVDWNSVSPTGNLFVEVKVINQSLYSPYKAVAEVISLPNTTHGVPKYRQESDGWLNIESVIRVPINRLNPSDNEFQVQVQPESMVSPSFPAGLPYTKADYFPAGSYFEDSLSFYLATATIVKDNGNGTYTQVASRNYQITDNSQCPDAVNTYALTDFTVKRTPASSSRKKDSPFGCGTVDFSGGSSGGGGPGGFFIGLILSLFLCSLTSSIIKQIKSKHDGKLA